MKNPTKLTGEAWINSKSKRNMDILLALGMLPIAVPVGAAALGLSRMIDGEGAVFRQSRIGMDGDVFEISKIRTMKVLEDDQSNGVDEKEITALGRLLRPLAIDETPQLLNVFSGDMSIVGPRPLPQNTLDNIQASLCRNLYDEWHHAFYSSRPGGISTYNIAFRIEGYTEDDCEMKARMDIEDFKNASFRNDLRLIRQAAAVGIKLAFSKQSSPAVAAKAGNT